MTQNLVLASASAVRARLLRDAGLAFEIVPSRTDENDLKARHCAEPAEDLAMILARAKAHEVSTRRAGAVVIGADQILECDGRRFDKPADRTEAAAHLRFLRGRAHRLITAASVFTDGVELWSHLASPRLRLRDLRDAEIEAYLARAGDGVLASVGVYQLEGLGIQLFEAIDGDYFSILGLPMLPLLAFLRGHGLLPP